MCVRPYILCTITSRIMTIHISSWRATWRGNAAQCSSANIMGRKSGSVIVGNVAIRDGKPDNTVRHTHLLVPRSVTLTSPSRCLHGAFGASRGWLGICLKTPPRNRHGWHTKEASTYPSGLWCHYTTWGPMSQRLSWVINCCLVFVRQWWQLCHASRSSTAQWQW